MGFGLLLCGYFVLTFMSFGMADYSFAAYIIGGFITINAAYRLKDYCTRFIWVIAAAGVYMLLGAYDVVIFMDELFLWGVMPIDGAFAWALDQVAFLAELFFHVALLLSVMEISTDVGIQKIRIKATRNLAFAGIWALCQVIFLAMPSVASYQNQVFTKMLVLFLLICYILNTLLLHSCYQLICPAGEEHGSPTKRSRFSFINKMNDKFDAKSAKALNESLEYRRQKQKAREEKRNRKKKK